MAQLDSLRVDHVGSLARPRRLLEMHRKVNEGAASPDDLRYVEDEAIRSVVAAQERIGFPVVTDGEFRRLNFQDSFGGAVSGFDAPQDLSAYLAWRGSRSTEQQRVESGPAIAGPPVVTRRPAKERLTLVRNLPLEEYRFMASVARAPTKVTLINPDRIGQRFDYQASKGAYDGLYDFMDHVASIEQEMVRQVAVAGCPYVQMDAPGYTAYVDGPSLEAMRARGEDPDENLVQAIAADNVAIDGIDGVTFGIHLCRGNERKIDSQTGKMVPQWHREGHYDAIAERLFTGLHHQRFLLEYDSERAGGFEPLRFVPKGKIVVLGLVTTKSTDVESVDSLMRRIEEASCFIPVEQLALSPQCGFASAASDALPEDVQWRKLEAVLETACRVWG